MKLHWVQWVTLLLLLVVAASSIVLYLRIENVQHHQNDALRSIMCHAEHVVKAQPDITAKQRHEALRFYETSLVAAHLKPCD